MTVPYRLTLAGRRAGGSDGPGKKRPCGLGREELERLQRNAAELGGVVIYDGRNAWVKAP